MSGIIIFQANHCQHKSCLITPEKNGRLKACAIFWTYVFRKILFVQQNNEHRKPLTLSEKSCLISYGFIIGFIIIKTMSKLRFLICSSPVCLTRMRSSSFCDETKLPWQMSHAKRMNVYSNQIRQTTFLRITGRESFLYASPGLFQL
jgi:hypothetical protein